MGAPELSDVSVLVVDDEPALAKLFEAFLEDTFDVLTATSGREALQVMNDDVDVVLLDRRMPDMNGDEVLSTIRERGSDAPVGMVTAVEPDLDIVDMPFDDYLKKPITRDVLVSKVEILARRATFDERRREFFRLASKKVTLEIQTGIDHADEEAYRELVHRMEELRIELGDTLDNLLEEDPTITFDP